MEDMEIIAKNGRPSIRQRMGKIPPGTTKLNNVIVASMKAWFADGISTEEVWVRLRERDYRVSLNTVKDVRKGRTWASVK